MMVLGLSRPAHTPQVTLSVKPMNQVSLKSSVVPVFPPAGLRNPSDLARAAVPLTETTFSRIFAVPEQGAGGNAG